MNPVRLTVLTLSIGTVLVLSRGIPAEDPADRPFAMGFTPFPYDITPEAVRSTDEFVAAYGDLVAHHFDSGVPWTEALSGAPFHPELLNDWERRKALGKDKKVYLALTPLDIGRTELATYRGEKDNLPLPETFRGKTLADADVRKAYVEYSRRAVDFFRPDWCVIGIEVNLYLLHVPERWPELVELYKETYAALKKDHPELPIGASFTLHDLVDPSKRDKHGQVDKVRAFLAENDFVGLSYYPFMAGRLTGTGAPLEWARGFTDKPLAIAETGFPAETVRIESFLLVLPSDEARQKAFFEALFARATQDRYLFVVAFLHRDYDALWEKIKASSSEFFVAWKDCGLLDEKGAKRPAFEVWERERAKKLVGR